MTWSNPEITKENIEQSIKQMEVLAIKLFDLQMTISSGFLEKMEAPELKLLLRSFIQDRSEYPYDLMYAAEEFLKIKE